MAGVTIIALPYVSNLLDTTRTIIAVLVIFVTTPLLYLWRMNYLGWSKKEITDHFNPFKSGKGYWELFFGPDRT
jgi:hypothetical protein